MFEEHKSLYQRKYGKDELKALPKSLLKGQYFQNNETASQEALQCGDVEVTMGNKEFYTFRQMKVGKEKVATEQVANEEATGRVATQKVATDQVATEQAATKTVAPEKVAKENVAAEKAAAGCAEAPGKEAPILIWPAWPSSLRRSRSSRSRSASRSSPWRRSKRSCCSSWLKVARC